MAPEILRYEKYDAKADLWSVGAVLYETAVGRPPFRAANHIELTRKIEQSRGVKFPDEDAPRAGADAPQVVPPDVKQLVRGLLRKIPAERLGFDEFFKSTALAKSKFPRPAPPPAPPAPEPAASASASASGSATGAATASQDACASAGAREGAVGAVPAHHRVIPPEVLDPHAMVPPSKFHFRRRESAENALLAARAGSPRTRWAFSALAAAGVGLTVCMRSPHTSPQPRTVGLPGSPLARSPVQSPRKYPRTLPQEGSLIPGETEEDGLLRKEYVLVEDTRAVDIHRTVDGNPLICHEAQHTEYPTEIHAARKRPLQSRRPTSAISPLLEPPSTDGSTDGMAIPPADVTFPPPPHPHAPYPVLSSSPGRAASRAASNALSRALSLASRRLFGAGGTRPSPPTPGGAGAGAGGSPRRAPLLGARDGAGPDPVEDALLAGLEERAQKTEVLTHWADELYEFVRAVPQSTRPRSRSCLCCGG
jgi:serine/threonine-protein kinase ULK/ATG1